MSRSPGRLGRLVGLAAALAVGAVPLQLAPASAGPAAYLLSTRVVDGTILTLRWNPCQAAVTYRVNATAAARTASGRAAAVADVRTAFAALGRATGITYRYLGTTSTVPTGDAWSDRLGDAEVLVAWVDQSRIRTTLLGRVGGSYAAGTGGYSYKTWTSPGQPTPQGVIGRGFLVLNAANNAAFAPGFGAGTTRGELLLHELGHVVGLRHVTTSAQLMYPVLVPRARAAYQSGDLAGLSRVGRVAGCIDVPAWVWPDR